jgi:hypothetical protein
MFTLKYGRGGIYFLNETRGTVKQVPVSLDKNIQRKSHFLFFSD